MQRLTGRLIARAAALALLTFVLGSTSLIAEELLASRLGALLGQERQAIAVVPAARLSALTAPPAAVERVSMNAPVTLSYSESFLASQPAPTGGDQWECLTEALYFEARGESVKGIFAVGEVILNRVDSGRFPGSVCSVVNQGTGQQYACQFSYNCDGLSESIHEQAAWNEVGKVAQILLEGAPRALTNGATHYHTRAVNPSWANRLPQVASIGSHLFYRQPTRTASN